MNMFDNQLVFTAFCQMEGLGINISDFILLF